MVRLARVGSIALAGCGLFLIFLDLGRAVEPSVLRRRLSNIWAHLAATPLADAPAFALGAALRSFDRFVVYWFEQSPRNAATAGAFTLIIFIAVPLAAVVNWLRGGSPVLVVLLIACIVGLLMLAILSETKRLPAASKILAPALAAAVFLVVPAYAFISLTDRALNIPIAHGALTSVLIAPLLYLVCHSAILLGAGAYALPIASLHAFAARRIATLAVAFLPFTYLATFAAFLIWHVVLPEVLEPSTWRTLVVVVGCSSLASAAAVHVATGRPGRREAPMGLPVRLATGFAIAAAMAAAIVTFGGIPADAPRTLAILPLAMPIILALIAASAFLGKIILMLAQLSMAGEPAADRPYRVAGIFALVLAAGAGWAAAAI